MRQPCLARIEACARDQCSREVLRDGQREVVAPDLDAVARLLCSDDVPVEAVVVDQLVSDIAAGMDLLPVGVGGARVEYDDGGRHAAQPRVGIVVGEEIEPSVEGGHQAEGEDGCPRHPAVQDPLELGERDAQRGHATSPCPSVRRPLPLALPNATFVVREVSGHPVGRGHQDAEPLVRETGQPGQPVLGHAAARLGQRQHQELTPGRSAATSASAATRAPVGSSSIWSSAWAASPWASSHRRTSSRRCGRRAIASSSPRIVAAG
jgi:hypothetical protein